MAKIDYSAVKDLHYYRNIGIIAHVDAGKTTTTERILYFTGKKHKIGEVQDGAAEMDFMVQERERGITITSAATTCFWSINDDLYRINIIDTPGHVDFTAEVERSLRVLDGAVVIFDGKMGVEPQSSKVWGQADKYNVPRLCFANKLNLIGGDFEMTLASIQDELSNRAVAIQYPIGKEHELRGYVDLVTMKAYEYAAEDKLEYKEIEIPANIKDRVTELHEILVEKVAEADDILMEKFLNDGVLEVEELRVAIRTLTLQSKIFPVMGGDSRMCDTKILLDNVCRYLPSPFQKVYTVEDKETGEVEDYIGKIAGANLDGQRVVYDVKEEEPLTALVFKITVDPHVGQLAFLRIYSGKLEAGSFVYNSTRDKKERVGRILLMHANHSEDITSARAGDIVGVVGFKESYTGNTICDTMNPVTIESIDFPDPVVSLAIEPKTKSDQEKLGEAMRKLMQEDPTFNAHTDLETGQTIISGMGELHLEIKMDILKRTYGIEVTSGKPQVAYKETISAPSTRHQEILKKQTGGSGQFADVVLILEPMERGKGYEFVNDIKGGAIPKEFIPSVDKGIKESLPSGVIGGFPVVDVRVKLVDGSYHDVDSNTDTFRIAGARGFKAAMKLANPILLEPIMKVSVFTPDDYAGDVTGALSAKRAVIKSMAPKGKMQEITCYVPLGNMFGWINQLRSMSKGKASSVMEMSHYEKVPDSLVNDALGIK
jgi:elongation factor G